MNRPTKTLITAIAFFLLVALFMTPETLIALGPLKQSLTSKYQTVRENTLLEVNLLRIGSALFAGLLAVVFMTWERIAASALVRRIEAHVPHDTERYARINRPLNGSFLIVSAFYLVSLVVIVVGPGILGHERYFGIIREDGITESTSAVMLLLACILAITLAFRFSAIRARRNMLFFSAFVFFVMLGEETSYGQRIFGIETFAFIKESNIQRENNLHNLYGYFADHFFTLALFVYGVLMPLVAYRITFFRKLIDYFGIPLPSKGLALAFLLISLLHNGIVYRIFTPPAHPIISIQCPEWREFLAAVALLVLMVETWLLVPRKKDEPGATPTA